MTELIVIFLAGLISAITPGPDVLYIVRNTLQHDIKSGFFSIMGVFTGCIFFSLLVYFGLTKIINNNLSQILLNIVGGIYLIYLAYLLLRQSNNINLSQSLDKNTSFYIKGLMINLSNPKVILFFAVIVTPFINNNLGVSLIFLLIGILSAFIIILLIATYSKKLLTNNFFNKIDKICSIVFLAFGISLLYSAYNILDNILLLE